MNDTTRRRLALLVLVASGFALIATSQTGGTVKTFEGEATVGPDQPGVFEVRFDVGRPTGGVFEDLNLHIDPLDGSDPRWGLDAVITTDGTTSHTRSDAELDRAPCEDGCTIDVRTTIAWIGRPEPPVNVRWRVTLIAAARDFNAVSVTGSVVDGREASVSPVMWLAIGGGVAAATIVFWLVAGARFAQIRLALMAGMAVVPIVAVINVAAGAAQRGTSLSEVLGGLTALLFAVALLVAAVIAALRRYLRGNPMYVAAVAVIYVALVGAGAFLGASAATTYRDYELVAWGLILGAPPAAALGSLRAVRGGTPSAARWSSLLQAAEVVLIGAYGLVAVVSFPGALLSLVSVIVDRDGLPARTFVESALIGLVPTAILALVVLGYVRWRRGDRRFLVVGNAIALVPVLFFALAGTLMATDLGFVGVFLAVPSYLIAIAAIVAIIAAFMTRPDRTALTAASIDPPPADGDRDQQRRKDDEVGRIQDERDRTNPGDDA